MKDITLGSLFDGSGGFPLAGAHAGITPVWAAEIEPYPIAVSSLHFIRMSLFELLYPPHNQVGGCSLSTKPIIKQFV